MALDRKHQKIFGANAQETDLGVVGSKNAGNPQYSTDIETLQSLSNWGTGLRALVTSTLAPYLQDQNSILYVITSQLAYLFQAGLAEWNAQTEYIANRSAVFKNGKIYIAIASSTNIEPEVTSNWGAYWKLYQYTLLSGNFFDSSFIAAGGSYPQGAIINYTDANGNIIQIKSLIDNNTTVPSASTIKTPSNTSATDWEIVSNKMTELFIKDKKIYVDGSNVLHFDTETLSFGNIGGFYFLGTSPNGTFGINFKNVEVQGTPIMRLPDYSTKTQVASSDNNTTSSWTATEDGWILAKFIGAVGSSDDTVFSINNNTIINEASNHFFYSGSTTLVPIGMYPVKQGDVVRVRRGIRAFFYKYR